MGQYIHSLQQTHKLSGPHDVQRCKENFGDHNVKIGLFTKLYFDENTNSYHTQAFRIEEQLVLMIFKVLTNQDISVLTFVASVSRVCPHWSFLDEMVFLLMGKLSEESIRSYNGLEWLLKYGRQKSIYQWDLKFLSAFCICMESVARLFQIPISDAISDVDRFTEDEDFTMIPQHMIKELVYWCNQIKGKENIFFTPFQIKMHKLFGITDSLHLSIVKLLK